VRRCRRSPGKGPIALMEVLGPIFNGFAVAAQPVNLGFLFLGALTGTVFGMMPGIGAATTIALLLPLTFGLDALPALIMLAGIYYGAMYGNTASAVLINTPGTASAAMTTVDGYPMAQRGRAGAALAISAIASFIAGTLSIVALTMLAVPLSQFALRFGPAEYFMLMLLALTAVSAFTAGSVAKGLLSGLLGLAIATVGVDMQTGRFRYTFGVPELQDGISFLVVIVGLFAVAEVFINVERWFRGESAPIRLKGRIWFTREEWRRARGAIARGGIIGFVVGVLPGTGGTIATVLAYATEKRISKTPEQFGKGAIEGVAAPEAANNAAVCGAFVPLLTLGVPGSGVAAVLLAAFILHGIQPGPLLFRDQPELVWGLIDSMYVGNIMLLLLNLPLIGIFVRVLYVPPGILMALILAIASIGIYATSVSVVDLYLLLAFGILGYAFRKLGIPVPPMILGVVLGASMEQTLRQAMIISGGDPLFLVGSPISATLGIMVVISLVFSVMGPLSQGLRLAQRRRESKGD
jgi:putative tricarboxylic transport membrane protein